MSEKTTEARFGTFKGVFTPSLLTILGVIMYLRFGWVVGEAGLIGAIAIVLLAHVISLTTDTWGEAKVRVNVVVDDEGLVEAARGNLESALETARVRATANVIVRRPAGRPIPEIMREVSGATDLVVLGLRPPAADETGFVARTNDLMLGLGTVLLVRGAERFDGAALLFDD